ncbi:DUF5915 domain-containing protein [Lysinibacillus sphaericus]|uniref:DUF5915 domain-containing protein n=1 Tax=Lysinibacillus sphaericus TaxID=1421 RepID=UPI002867D0E8|nr:DUF5915 domain-containing protein [Lysinibacillus sphaericus]
MHPSVIVLLKSPLYFMKDHLQQITHVLKESIVKEQHVLAKENECRVLLDTHLTEDLLQEGQIRELIRTIQETRKKWQLPVEQYISLSISTDAETVKIIQQYMALSKANVWLNDILFGESAIWRTCDSGEIV